MNLLVSPNYHIEKFANQIWNSRYKLNKQPVKVPTYYIVSVKMYSDML